MKQIIVIGCGRFGSSVARTFTKLGHDVMVIDNDLDKIKDISEHVAHAVQMDAMDEASFRTLGLRNFDYAIIAISSDIESSIMATLIAKEAGVPIVIAKAATEIHGKLLEKIGADKVIYPERDMGMRVAYSLASPSILDIIEFSPEYSIIETVALEQWESKSLKELSLPKNMTVLAIKTGKKINISPSPDSVIEKDDVLVVLGNNDALNKFTNFK